MTKKKRTVQDDRGSIQKLFDRFTLSWRLMADRRVGVFHKLIPPLAVLYVLSPVDFIPELLVPILGPLVVMDDIAIAIMALEFFIRMAPSDVVREHLMDLQGRMGRDSRYDGDDVVEGEYSVRE
jgi:uncharacterized membrane protein YkvA (DUF1232 family)